jgi:hypothetical protein
VQVHAHEPLEAAALAWVRRFVARGAARALPRVA